MLLNGIITNYYNNFLTYYISHENHILNTYVLKWMYIITNAFKINIQK